MLLETSCCLPTDNLYQAHAKLDGWWQSCPRNGKRFWRYGLLPLPVAEQSIAVVRLPQAVSENCPLPEQADQGWREISAGTSLVGAVLITPKKPTQWSLFRNDGEWAAAYVQQRLAGSGIVHSLELSQAVTVPVSRSVGKGRPFAVPARYAFFRVEGEPQALETLLLQGIGGQRAFGLGFVMTDPLVTEIMQLLASA